MDLNFFGNGSHIYLFSVVWGLAVPVCFWSNRRTNQIARRDFIIVHSKNNEIEKKTQ